MTKTAKLMGIEPSYATYEKLMQAYSKLEKQIGRLYNTYTSLSEIQELWHQAEESFDNEMAAFIRRGIAIPETTLPRLYKKFPDIRPPSYDHSLQKEAT